MSGITPTGFRSTEEFQLPSTPEKPRKSASVEIIDGPSKELELLALKKFKADQVKQKKLTNFKDGRDKDILMEQKFTVGTKILAGKKTQKEDADFLANLDAVMNKVSLGGTDTKQEVTAEEKKDEIEEKQEVEAEGKKPPRRKKRAQSSEKTPAQPAKLLQSDLYSIQE